MDHKAEENARVQRILGSQDGKASILPLKTGGKASKANCYADGGMVTESTGRSKVDQKRPPNTTVNVIVAPNKPSAPAGAPQGDQPAMNPNAMKAALAQAAATRPPLQGMPASGPALPQWAQALGKPGGGGMPMKDGGAAYTAGAGSGVGRLEKIKEYGPKG